MKPSTKAAHTPGPWRVHTMWNGAHDEIFVQVQGPPEDRGALDALSGRSIGAERPTVARCGTTRQESTEANAEFIVRACNSHEELLAAAKLAMEIVLARDPQGLGAHYQALTAAIAKAEGGK